MEKLSVINTFYQYLPLTQSWLYRLLVNIPDVNQVIVSKKISQNYYYNDSFIYIKFPIQELDKKDKSNIIVKVINKAIREITKKTFNKYVQYKIRTHQIKPDILHSHFGTVGWEYIPLAKTLNVKHVVSFYGFDYEYVINLDPVWKIRYKTLFEEADLFICEGKHGAKILKNLGCPSEKIKIIKLGVEIDKTPFFERNKKENELKLLQIASFKEKKGHYYTVKAFAEALKYCPNMSLTLVGSGETKKNIENLVRNLNIEKYVKFLDEIEFDKLHNFMKDFHVFIHPSCYAKNMDCEGGAPIVILDAQATGMPVISTNHCDIPEEVIHNKTGFLAEEKNYKQLAKYIVEFYKMSLETYKKFSYKAREHIEKNYNIKDNARKLRELYDML